MEINHNPSYLFLSREDEDDVRDIGKHDFPSAPLQPMLSNANRKSDQSVFSLSDGDLGR